MKLHLYKLNTDSTGYAGHRYYGLGPQLWQYEASGADFEAFGVLRAETREQAKQEIRKLHPSARFFR